MFLQKYKRRSDGSFSKLPFLFTLFTTACQLVAVFSQPRNAPGYLGCYNDCDTIFCRRALPIGPEVSGDQSVEWCFKYCLDTRTSSYNYAGLVYANECFCGNNEDYDRFGKKADSECQDRCTGNSNQFCGDSDRISIYRISQGVCSNAIGPPTNGDHAITNPRSLSYNLNNFKFFGTQVDFSCDPGYTLHGASSIECIETDYNNVTWSDSVPTCKVPQSRTTTIALSTTPPLSRTTTVVSSAVASKSWTTGVDLITSNDVGSSKSNTRPTTSADVTVGVSSSNEPSDVGVIVGPLVAGLIVVLAALGLLIICMWRRKKRELVNDCDNQLVRNDSSNKQPNHISQSLRSERQDQVCTIQADGQLEGIPLGALSTANDYNPGREIQAAHAAYGNVGPNLSLSRDLVEIEKEIGRGAFGRVLLGTALGIEEVGKRTKVAIKTIKEGADRQAKVELLEELDVMKKIGSHPNIVRLLGYCIETDPIYLIVEYLGKGDLKKVLMGYRITDTGTGYGNISGLSQSLSLTLVKFARDVANGMAFLASQKCIHRDLAARNVLVGEDMVCKVSDFGLARDVMNIRVYQRESQGPLPMRWMALESLIDDVYTIESDVWSFGILIWEIVTLGARPYPHIMTSKDMVRQLRKGYRMSKPTNCKKQLYSIMRSCWHTNPKARPTFQDVVESLEALLSEEMEYITVRNIDEGIYEVPRIMEENEKV
ncbi:tyrosine kinase receptor Cad96Ca-like [Patiria miniata]|uniref:receptor protein-tyrosine kinase n=1 Tax=Patiria miniata TaxID=46514 RepID=A0A913ZX09_PATMI|nr:tyrosine kinase receptor Cad96Ca-like [Patiria miniata]